VSQSKALVDRWLDRIKNNRLTAAIIVTGVVVSGVAGLWTKVSEVFATHDAAGDAVLSWPSGAL
jgi:hypothetical protein